MRSLVGVANRASAGGSLARAVTHALEDRTLRALGLDQLEKKFAALLVNLFRLAVHAHEPRLDRHASRLKLTACERARDRVVAAVKQEVRTNVFPGPLTQQQ